MKTVACPASSGSAPAPVENLTHTTECFPQLNGVAAGPALPCYLPAGRLEVADRFLAVPEPSDAAQASRPGGMVSWLVAGREHPSPSWPWSSARRQWKELPVRSNQGNSEELLQNQH